MKHMMIKVLSLVMALTMIMGMFGAVAVSAAGHTHTKGEKVKTVAPTCVAYGYTLYECAGCGEQYADDVLPKTEECQNIEDVKAVEATCTTDAKAAGKKCKDCGLYVEGGEVVPNTKLGHNYDIMLIQPTCTEVGVVIEACTRCFDATKDWDDDANEEAILNVLKVIPSTSDEAEHTYTYVITVAPTCTDAGKATYKCVKCNEINVENIYVAPSEALHNWVDVDDEATCLNPGLKGKECTECWNYLPDNDENGDGVKNIKDVVAPYGHNRDYRKINEAKDLPWIVENGFDADDFFKAATCTEDGFEWVYCNDCKAYVKLDATFTDKDGKNPYKATGHTLPNAANDKLIAEVVKDVKTTEVGKTIKKDYTIDDVKYSINVVVISKADCENGSVIACTNCLTAAGGTVIWACEETLTLNDQLRPEHTHNWATEPAEGTTDPNWVVTEPDCENAGYTTVKCKQEGCTATKKINVKAALGHDKKYPDNGNCVTGFTVKCDREGCTWSESIKNAEHTTVVKKIAATCSEYAYDANVCTVAGCKYYVAVDANNDGKADKVYTEEGFDSTKHSAKYKVQGAYYIPATCVSEGVATYACGNCAAPQWTEKLDMLEDHKWIKIEQVDATCQNTGVTAGYICLTCPVTEGVKDQYAANRFGRQPMTGTDAKGKAVSTNGVETWVWVSGGNTIALDKNNHETTRVMFHREGTCTMPELYLYECACGATWSKEYEKDTTNHNSYTYNTSNKVIGGTYVPASVSNGVVVDVATITDGEHWGALLEYKAGKDATCTTDGNHNYVVCKGCKEVVAISPYKLSIAADGSIETSSEFDCVICEKYIADQLEENDGDSTKGTGVVACPALTLVLKDTGKAKVAVDWTKTTVAIEIKAVGHKEKAVDAVVEDCEKPGYTAGVKCENTHCCSTAPVNEGTAESPKLVCYISGHNIIQPHGDRFVKYYWEENNLEEGFMKEPTCTEYGINGNAKYCTVCESRIKDITKHTWYVAPKGHSLEMDTNWAGSAKSCDSIGFVAYVCNACDVVSSVWTDLNANGVVDVTDSFSDSSVALKDSEYTWFITDYDLAIGHEWNKYDLDKKTGYYEGWYIEGEILTTAEFVDKYNFVPNTCLVATVKYITCKNGCTDRQAVADVVPATGHFHVEASGAKTAISTDCAEIEKWYGFTCDGCGLTIGNKDQTTHNLVVVAQAATCSKPGLFYWACVDCETAFYAVDKSISAPIYEIYESELEVITKDKKDDDRVVVLCKENIEKIDAYVKATATTDGYYTYKCITCKETFTQTIKASEDVKFTFTATDVNGSKVTANGNTIVVSIAYTAKSYKFRSLETEFFFASSALTFQKAEVKAEFAADLAVTTEVDVNNGKVNILTVANAPKTVAELTGDKVAYVDLYFTVNDYTYGEGVVDTFVDAFEDAYEYTTAYIYDEDGELGVDTDAEFKNVIGDVDVEVAITGDVDAMFDDITTSDLVSLMDIIYTTDAAYEAVADINKDGKIDIDDFAALRTFLVSDKTIKDYIVMLGENVTDADLAKTIVDILNVQKIDINGDRVVNDLDFVLLINYVMDYIEDYQSALEVPDVVVMPETDRPTTEVVEPEEVAKPEGDEPVKVENPGEAPTEPTAPTAPTAPEADRPVTEVENPGEAPAEVEEPEAWEGDIPTEPTEPEVKEQPSKYLPTTIPTKPTAPVAPDAWEGDIPAAGDDNYDAYLKYVSDKNAYDQAFVKYATAMTAYNEYVALENEWKAYDEWLVAYPEAKAAYDEAKATYDAYVAYLEAVELFETYDERKATYDAAKAEYDAYVTLVEAWDAYDVAKAQYDLDKAAYDTAKTAYDTAKTAYDTAKTAYDAYVTLANTWAPYYAYVEAKAAYDAYVELVEDWAEYDAYVAAYDKYVDDYYKYDDEYYTAWDLEDYYNDAASTYTWYYYFFNMDVTAEELTDMILSTYNFYFEASKK